MAETSWIFRTSCYSHDPATGERVNQFTPEKTAYVRTDPTYQESVYRHSRSGFEVDGSYDYMHTVETWGQGESIRPYGEWLYPYRAGATPFGPWPTPQGLWDGPQGPWGNLQGPWGNLQGPGTTSFGPGSNPYGLGGQPNAPRGTIPPVPVPHAAPRAVPQPAAPPSAPAARFDDGPLSDGR